MGGVADEVQGQVAGILSSPTSRSPWVAGLLTPSVRTTTSAGRPVAVSPQASRKACSAGAGAGAEAATQEANVLKRCRWTAQVAASLPELGWSVSEALFMPLLLRLHLPANLLTICWLFSPVLGFALHPVVGALIDVHGRRPFVILFGLLSAAGLALMPVCAALPSGGGAALAVLAFGLADTAHDLMLTPTSAAMNDVYEAEECEHRCAVISGLGKILGLVLAACLHASDAFWSTAAIMAGASAFQLIAPRERMSLAPSDEISCFGTRERPLRPPRGFALVWVLQFVGWLCLCVYSFYFTSVWAQESGATPDTHGFEQAVRFATLLLIAGSICFTAAGAVLPALVKLAGGEQEALVGALAACTVLFFAFGVAPAAFSAVGAVIVFPVAYQVVARVPYCWIEQQPGFDQADRGRLTGRLTMSLSAAQAVTALAGGPIVAAAGGRLVAAYRACGVAAALAASAGLLAHFAGGRQAAAEAREALLATAPAAA